MRPSQEMDAVGRSAEPRRCYVGSRTAHAEIPGARPSHVIQIDDDRWEISDDA